MPGVEISYPGARRPDRYRSVDAHGLRLAVYEWGDEKAPPLLLAHGGFDFAGTFDTFAPLLADGGWRVVSWDHRGHGDSQHAELYSWDADGRDMLAVLDATTSAPLPVAGHSKGGNMLLTLCAAMPERVTKFVNIDGMPSPGPHPDISDHEQTAWMTERLAVWLDGRRTAHEALRRPGTIDDLAARRGRMNPRLSMEWLRYLVPIGAREDEDGWRWKIDPVLRRGGFGPWRHQWTAGQLASLQVPLLGIIGTEPEEMGWGTDPEDLRAFLPAQARLEVLDGVGHFVHVERPRQVADLVLEFLA